MYAVTVLLIFIIIYTTLKLLQNRIKLKDDAVSFCKIPIKWKQPSFRSQCFFRLWINLSSSTKSKIEMSLRAFLSGFFIFGKFDQKLVAWPIFCHSDDNSNCFGDQKIGHATNFWSNLPKIKNQKERP